MSQNNLKQPGVQISESLWKQFRQDIQERRGGVRGHLRTELENAIREYLEASKGGDINDRLRRIENTLESIEEGAGGQSGGENVKNKKDSGVSSTVKNRVESIQKEIDREAGEADKVHESVINNAIENHAGSSRPTLDRYREMLEQRHIAHEWPVGESSMWWLNSEKFVGVLESNFPQETANFRETFGPEWWESQLDSNEWYDEPDRGFQ